MSFPVFARATTDAWRARGCTFQGCWRRTFCAHLSLGFQIALVSDNDDGEVVLVLDAQNLLLECDDLLEALARRYAVDEQEALACPHILLAHGRVLLLAGRVEHVQQRDLLINHTLLPVRVCRRWLALVVGRVGTCRRLRTFDGRIVFVDEMALDELDGQATLSDTTTTDYHELVFPEELR
jgi:hypothetical protein